MLYIFQVDSGNMLTLDMNLALESVAKLKSVLLELCKIPVEKQVLLISGGYSLEPSARVCNYSAGTDTSPIFLFDKTAIENLTPPYLEPALQAEEIEMREKVEGSLNMPPTYNTVVSRAQLAQEFFEISKEQRRNCERLVHDQHLMQQGWAAVVANLEDITGIFRARSEAIQKSFLQYLEQRSNYLELLNNFRSDLSLLSKIPVLPILLKAQEEESREETTVNLLHWISSKDNQNSLEQMAEICTKCLNKFDESVLRGLLNEVVIAMHDVDNMEMKEIKGLEERLCGLEQLMFEARKTVDDQGGLAQAFHQNQSRASNLKDASILPDLCASHKQQLQLVLKNQQFLCDIKRRCLRAKGELCYNLHARLRWIMFVEGKLHELDNKLSIYNENLKRIRGHLEVVSQIHQAPRVYMAAVAEVLRRRDFSKIFLQWADQLSNDSKRLHQKEVETRQAFNSQLTNHFLSNLFPGMEDCPPPFATETPSIFDVRLPAVEGQHLDLLRRALPELGYLLDISPEPLHMPCSQQRPPVSASTQTVTSESGLDTYMTRSGGSESRSESSLAAIGRRMEKEGGAFHPIREEVWLGDEDFETLEHNIALADHLDESHRSQLIKAGSEPGGGTGVVRDSDESMQRARSEGDVTLPLTISQDFMTADFYIDESMPSSYTESNGVTNRGVSSATGHRPIKSHHAISAEIQNQLEERNAALVRTKEELRLKSVELLEEKAKFELFKGTLREELLNERRKLVAMKEDLAEDQRKAKEQIMDIVAKVNQGLVELNVKFQKERELHTICQHKLNTRTTMDLGSLQLIFEMDPLLEQYCNEHPNEIVTDDGTNFGTMFILRNQTIDSQKISDTANEILPLQEKIRSLQLELNDCHALLTKKDEDKLFELTALHGRLEAKFERETKSLRVACSRLVRHGVEELQVMWRQLQESQEQHWEKVKANLYAQFGSQTQSLNCIALLDSFAAAVLARWGSEESLLAQHCEKALKQLRSATQCSRLPEHKHDDTCTTSLDAFDIALSRFVRSWENVSTALASPPQHVIKEIVESLENVMNDRIEQQKGRDTMSSSVQSEPNLDFVNPAMMTSGALSSPPSSSVIRFPHSIRDCTKVSVLKCTVDDVVLLTYDEKHDRYVVFILDATLHFLKTECLDVLGLSHVAGQPRRAWALGVVTDKEYCKAKKFPNRYRVPQDTRFYRVTAKPWPLVTSSMAFAPST